MKSYIQQKRWKFVVLLSVLLCLVLVPSSSALEILNNSVVTIKAGEVIEDDLIVFANELILDGTVKGDLIFFVTKATLNGVVEGDLMGGGQEIFLNGTFNDDVRVGGNVITIGEAAQVEDDFMAGGYSLESVAGSLVQGDMFFGGVQSRLAGDMAGNLYVGTGGLELLGHVAGDVRADVDAASEAPPVSPFMFMPGMANVPTFKWGLALGEDATIGGNLDYSAPLAVEIPTDVVAGKISFEQVVQPVATETAEPIVTPTQQAWNWTADLLRQLVTLLLIGFLMVWLTPRWTGKVADFVQKGPLPAMGWGVLAIAAIFVAMVLALVVMIILASALGVVALDGLSGAVVVMGLFVIFTLILLFAFTTAYFAKIVVATAGGRYIFHRFNSPLAENRYWSMALGVLLIVLLAAIPWVGPLVSLVVLLLGFGALWQEGFDGWKHRLGMWRIEEPASEMKVKPA